MENVSSFLCTASEVKSLCESNSASVVGNYYWHGAVELVLASEELSDEAPVSQIWETILRAAHRGQARVNRLSRKPQKLSSWATTRPK